MKVSFFRFPVRALVFGSLLVGTTQCSVSERVKEKPSEKASISASSSEDEAREDQAYGLMQYRLNFMDEARLGGQDILFVRQASDLTSPQQAKLQAALQSGSLPLRLRMRVYARNASKETIRLQQFDYQLVLDGRELLAGRTADSTEVEPSSIITVPIAVDFNVTPSLLHGSTPAAFAAGLTDFTGSARRLTMRVRPVYISTTGRITQSDDYQDISLVTAKRTAKQ